MDVYLTHWPARYSPQANWGQSLEYNHIRGEFSKGGASFEELAESMGKLVEQGKIRGWGLCNDNTYGARLSGRDCGEGDARWGSFAYAKHGQP